MKARAFITLCISLFWFCVYAQGPAYKDYTTSEGLPGNNIYSAIQDDDGFMWFATDNGVSRFDGSHFKNFSTAEGLPDRSVLNIIKDSFGRLWFLSFSGKVSFYQNGQIYNSKNCALLKPLNFSSTMACVYEDSKKNIWISFTEGKTICLTPAGHIKVFNIPGNYIWENNKGKLQMVTGRTIYTLGDTGFNAIHFYPGMNLLQAVHFPGDSILMLVGNVEHATGKTIFGKYNLNSNHLHLDTLNNYPPGFIRSITVDNNKQIWASTLAGAIKFDTHTISSGADVFFQNRSVNKVFQDNHNNYWFASAGNGIFMVPSLNVRLYDVNSGLVENNISSALVTEDSSILVGSENRGLQWIKHDVVINKDVSIIPPEGKILKLGKDNAHNIWILTDAALFKYSNGKFTKVPDSTGFNKTIFITPDDSVWIGHGAGLKKITGNHIAVKYWGPINRVYAIAQIRDNEFWLGTDKGLYSFRNDEMIKQSHGDSLLTKRINTLAVSADSALWIGTDDNGLIRFKNNGKTIYYSVKNGLLSNHCNGLLSEGNKIYLATDKGLNILREENNLIRISSYSSDNGLVSGHINQVIKKGENIILLATDKGLVETDERTIPPFVPGKPYIDAVMVNDIDQKLQHRFSLHYNENNIQIDFGAINFNTSRNDIIFHYKLSGLDTGWNHTTSGSVKYNHLAPGNYTFMVKTDNSNSAANQQLAFFDLYIETPFWQTWWFRTISIVILLTVASLIVKNRLDAYGRRVNQQRRVAESELKALRAQINPHFIFNSLNSIQSFIMKNQKENANIYLSKFAVLMRGILNHSRASTITLEEEIESLKLYLELEAFVYSEQFSFQFEVDEQINADEIMIPSMILQPYVENAIIHGLATVEHGGLINISFSKKNDSLICTIADNGIGRKKAAELRSQKVWKNRPSLGMQVTKERIDLLNMGEGKKIELEITDITDDQNNSSGTLVSIIFPIVPLI